MRFAHEYVLRNTRPARGEDVFTLTQLRHYVRLFLTDRRYGICGIYGGRQAFKRFCGTRLARHIRHKIAPDVPESEYLPADLQRLLSRKVHQVLRGEIIFVSIDGKEATWRPMLGKPEPPMPDAVPFHDHEFRIVHTAIGPRIAKL